MLQAGDIVVKRDSKITVLRYIPTRTPCIIRSITHGEPMYWLEDARTREFVGGMCTELMTAFRKARVRS